METSINSLISPLAYIHPEAKIGSNVKVYPFAYIEKDTVIGDNCVIMSHTSILSGVEMGTDNIVYQNAVIGAAPQSFRYEKGKKTKVFIGNFNHIRENVVISGGFNEQTATTIGDANFLMDNVHICHDVKIGNNCVLGIDAQMSGESLLENNIILSSSVVIHRQVRVGKYSLVQSGCRVQKDVPPYIILSSNPTKYHGVNAVILQKAGLDERALRHISNAYRLIFSSNVSLEDSVLRIKEQIPNCIEKDTIIEFINQSKIGIIKRENE